MKCYSKQSIGRYIQKVVHLNFNPALALITFQEPDPDKVLKKTYVIHVFVLEGKDIFF